MNEEQLENLCLDWFREGGWDVLHGPDIAPDSATPMRSDYAQVILDAHLFDAFKRINKHIPSDQLDNCYEQLKVIALKPESMDLITNNHAFHRLLLEGVPVEFKKNDGKTISDHVFLIDFENLANNQFAVVNQFTISGTKQHRRPDVICFINGLPIAVLELKNPVTEKTDVWEAFDQIQTYKDELSNLFVYNEALIISDGFNARIGSLTAERDRFMPWHTIKNENDKPQVKWQLETVVKGFFDRELLLDYIRFFVLFENDTGKISKKIAGYHQFHAAREAVKATIIASALKQQPDGISEKRARYGDEVIPRSRKAGIVWHTQGSGKSMTMCCYAGKLLKQRDMYNPTIVVVTDRNDLDGQLFSTFSNAVELLEQTPIQAGDRDALRQLLSEREAGGIIFTTIQKFTLLSGESSYPVLNNRRNIVVISDEAHRSHYGFKATLNNDGHYTFGYATHLRDALPFASFIGFTGTPISTEDKDTRAVFGDYVSIYDIEDAYNDGVTVRISHESRHAKLDLNHADIAKLSDEFEEVIEDEEDIYKREQTKGNWSRLEKLVGATPRLTQIAEDLITHFETRTATIEGKGMIVGMSRNICVNLYNEIVKLQPQWHDKDPEKGTIKIIMTGSASDKPELQPHIYNKETKKRLERRFKDPSDPLKLVIVRDMWLTGFDVPCCHTMYIDKPMKGHNLMQAIARVNRVFKDKPDGRIVDYLGIIQELKQAFRTYIDSDDNSEFTVDIYKSFDFLREKIDALRGLFSKTPQSNSFDISELEHNAQELLRSAANHILESDDKKKRFFDLVLEVNKLYALCSTLEETKYLKKEIAFYSQIKVIIKKSNSVDKKHAQEQKTSVFKRILDNAVIPGGIVDLLELCEIDNSESNLFSDSFLDDIRKIKYKNLAVELLKTLCKDGIKSKMHNNIVQEKKFSERLQETLIKYNNRNIEPEQIIEELIQIAKDIQADLTREVALQLNPDELAFYDALANNESAVRKLGDETLKKIAVEITEKLRKSTTVDWQVRDSVRAKLKILVRRTLQRWKYPPDKQIEAVNLVLKQAETLSNAWTK